MCPKDVTELRRFLEMVNHLGKFAAHLSEKTKPLRDLLSSKNQWCWNSPKQQAFEAVKEELCSTRILACYCSFFRCIFIWSGSSPETKTGEWRLETSCICLQESHSYRAAIRPNQKRGTSYYLGLCLGRSFHVETDHKPLVPLLSTKNLEELPLE